MQLPRFPIYRFKDRSMLYGSSQVKSLIPLISVALFLAACVGPATQPPPTAPSATAEASAVAEASATTEAPTAAPATPTVAPTEAPAEEPTIPPKPTSSSDSGEFALAPDQVSLDSQGLPYSWQALVVPVKPYDESMPPGPTGLPTHIEILFGSTDPAEVRPGDPTPALAPERSAGASVMYIIPVDPYREMWNDAGNPAVTVTIQEIQRLNFILVSPAPTSGYPALPYEQIGGYNDLAVQVGKAVPQNELNTSSATQDGYRFVGRWAQDANPVTNVGLRYVYQGFTNDGVYLVSFWWPVTTSALPDDVSQVPAEGMEAFNADPGAYIGSMAEMLNSLSPDQWEPDLTTLDTLVASLGIQGTTPSGLLDKTWEWTQGPVQPGSSEIVSVPDPESYQVTYGSDGTLTYRADCASSTSSFELNNGGMTGGMLVEPGSLTAPDCGPDSLAGGFVNALAAAQSYAVWAGGSEMQLILPAGGGILLLRDANTPSPEGGVACITGTITYPEGIPLPEDAVVQIQVQDTSLADAPAIVMGEQIITSPGQVPIDYQVCYDPSQIQENHTYSMSVRITDADGRLLFINDTHIPVITRGNPTENVEIVVIPVGG
jgi:putative lipoprotein